MYLRTIEFTGEVKNVCLGNSYTKVDFLTIDPCSKYAKELVAEANRIVEETTGIEINLWFAEKDNIMIESESGQQYWLDSRHTHYIVGNDGKTLEKITPKEMNGLSDWAKVLDRLEK